ncbi:unnamed protein product [Diatraea saccharalis]|uniref:Protein SERAC1 n=1 Tax=Diatraea saccharalis TaxID=40085 RepID=A0A9N9WGI3_9NEOP|nr:unnamed protein product [Diatraea saccharalis]
MGKIFQIAATAGVASANENSPYVKIDYTSELKEQKSPLRTHRKTIDDCPNRGRKMSIFEEMVCVMCLEHGHCPHPPAGCTVVKSSGRARAPGRDHLHPEPLVECQVLHTPAVHNCDVIFVHGLYGSLGNTWRQGDWRPKYKSEPNKIPLLRPTDCKCDIGLNSTQYKVNDYEDNINELTYKDMEEKLYKGIKKILPNEEAFIAEKFYNNTFLDQVEIVDNYDSQVEFVKDLFQKENTIGDNKNDLNVERRTNEVACKINEVDCKCKSEKECNVNGVFSKVNRTECDNKVVEVRECRVGCGCVCDRCYSSCWPRDWIKEDYPDARVISINYTSDPYLWRPLWIKESKRLRLHERAEQMTKQLLDLRVGDKPVIWVGHSKGGLFIKQIYCEAYEAYKKIHNQRLVKEEIKTSSFKQTSSDIINNNSEINIPTDRVLEQSNLLNETNFDDNEKIELKDVLSIENERYSGGINKTEFSCKQLSSDRQEDYMSQQCGLWKNSVGFMFYSVPHRGSPLADIKTPITARSIELLEISKDCGLVVSLQERWLAATADSRPQVRSLVETSRTLMSLLWLRIVSVPSADAGIGALYGVSVDHREICKPSSRQCLLYKELIGLMNAALKHCRCESSQENHNT